MIFGAYDSYPKQTLLRIFSGCVAGVKSMRGFETKERLFCRTMHKALPLTVPIKRTLEGVAEKLYQKIQECLIFSFFTSCPTLRCSLCICNLFLTFAKLAAEHGAMDLT